MKDNQPWKEPVNALPAAEFIDKVMTENIDASISADEVLLRILRANFLSGVSLAVAMIREHPHLFVLTLAQIDGATDILAKKYDLGVTRSDQPPIDLN